MLPLNDPAGLDAHLVNLAYEELHRSGLGEARALSEATYILPAMRHEVVSARAHEIDEAEIVESVTTMAQMHCFVATGQARSTVR